LLEKITPIDRGVAKPLHTDNAVYTLTRHEREAMARRAKRIKRYQRQLARQQKGSRRRWNTIRKITRLNEKTAHVRENFWHQTTRQVVDNSQVVVIEDLKLKNMTRRAKAKQCPETGRWLKNGATAKAGLNRAILNVGLGRFEVLLRYKMAKAGKALFKVAPHHTSQECACCGHIHPGNRKNQADFRCTRCHFTANADFNAALVIRKRAITLIKHSGTELAGTQGNVLQPGTDAKARKTRGARAHRAGSCLLKKTVAAKRPEARLL
jgi:putative transposase